MTSSFGVVLWHAEAAFQLFLHSHWHLQDSPQYCPAFLLVPELTLQALGTIQKAHLHSTPISKYLCISFEYRRLCFISLSARLAFQQLIPEEFLKLFMGRVPTHPNHLHLHLVLQS